MIVSDNVIQAEGFSGFFKNLCEKGLNVSKRMAKNILKNPSRALEIGANVATAAASRNPEVVLSTFFEVIFFIIQAGVFIWVNLYNLSYINGTKNR